METHINKLTGNIELTTRENLTKKKCPRCKDQMSLYPAISRRDNKTKICVQCGTDEALFDYHSYKLQSDGHNLQTIIQAEKAWLKQNGKHTNRKTK